MDATAAKAAGTAGTELRPRALSAAWARGHAVPSVMPRPMPCTAASESLVSVREGQPDRGGVESQDS